MLVSWSANTQKWLVSNNNGTHRYPGYPHKSSKFQLSEALKRIFAKLRKILFTLHPLRSNKTSFSFTTAVGKGPNYTYKQAQSFTTCVLGD